MSHHRTYCLECRNSLLSIGLKPVLGTNEVVSVKSIVAYLVDLDCLLARVVDHAEVGFLGDEAFALA